MIDELSEADEHGGELLVLKFLRRNGRVRDESGWRQGIAGFWHSRKKEAYVRLKGRWKNTIECIKGLDNLNLVFCFGISHKKFLQITKPAQKTLPTSKVVKSDSKIIILLLLPKLHLVLCRPIFWTFKNIFLMYCLSFSQNGNKEHEKRFYWSQELF